MPSEHAAYRSMFDATRAPRHANGAEQPHDFPFVDYADLGVVLDTTEFVRGLLLYGSAVVVYGQSNSGKTFWTTTLALHVAAGWDFAGHRVEQGGVIYVALEGSIGFRNRVAAWKAEHGLEGYSLPFKALMVHVDMLNPDNGLGDFIAAVNAVKAEMSAPLRLIVIDTLARAMSGGNENSPDHMGQLVQNTDRLRLETGACVLYVHHSGKDQAKGGRGHSSLQAAIDTEIEIVEGEDGVRTATVLKQREIDKGAVIPFTLRKVELGCNPHGEPVTTCLVDFPDPDAPTVRTGRPPQHHLPPAAQIGMRALDIALSKHGALLPPLPEYPANTVAVGSDRWRDEFYHLKGGDPDLNRKTFNRGEDYLLAKTIVTQRNGFVWKVSR